MFKSLLISLVKEVVFDALVRVLAQEAQKTHTPIDDTLIDYLKASKPDLMAALTKAL